MKSMSVHRALRESSILICVIMYDDYSFSRVCPDGKPDRMNVKPNASAVMMAKN